MKEKDWCKFKKLSEEKFKSLTLKNVFGFQIQKDTKWNDGLSNREIKALEIQFGFKFPVDYVEMLKVFNGFQTLQISIDPEGNISNQYDGRCYQYPVHFEKTNWLIDEANQYIEYVIGALEQSGFDSIEIDGFVPLFGHRVLVVLKDKTKSPVLSIWGDDIIVYGENLMQYWCNELGIEFNALKRQTS